MKKALILIDIQNDFISGSLPVAHSEEIITPVNELMNQFEHIIATQDWHPTEHFSFFIHHKGKKLFDVIEKDGYTQTLWPPHCIQGGKGADFYPSLNTKPISLIIRKGTNPEIDSYSAFFDNQKLKNTGLDGYLKGLQIEELHFVGIAADYCVYYSMKDALELGYKVVLHENCTRAIQKEAFEIQKKELLEHKNFKIVSN
ncbi:MAG: bifunctional nicotinamidase/pyrazinamidase [Capnocytophaga sp.]|nr:bifunctional nicotinamidase/pyrazinamidase [Capnocytophaga sp.]